MKLIECLKPENGLTQDPLYHFHFEDYRDSLSDFYLFTGDFYSELYSGRYDDKKKVVLTLEEPNFCVGDSPIAQLHEHADLILTLCPYTAKSAPRRRLVFFPFSDWYIDPTEDNMFDIPDRKLDACYFGSFPTHPIYTRGHEFSRYITHVFPKYESVYGHYNAGNAKGCSYTEKLMYMRNSKTSLIHGLCNSAAKDLDRFRSFPGGYENHAFDYILQLQVTPQVKSRMFESAFMGSIMLVQRDPWNLINLWFEEGKDFLFFDGEKEYTETLNEVINHYGDYVHLAESAYKKAMNNYTIEHFVNEYLRDV